MSGQKFSTLKEAPPLSKELSDYCSIVE